MATKPIKFLELHYTMTQFLIIVYYSPKAKWIFLWIFPETKSREIFTNIHEPEANNCFIIITQVITEIPKQRNVTILPQFAIVDKNSFHAARIDVSRNAFLNSRSEEKISFVIFNIINGIKQIECG